MSLNVDIRPVAKSIDNAKNMFNGKAIENAQTSLREFALGAERQVNELGAKINMMSTENAKLREDGQRAVEKLNQAQAKIQYQETQIANTQKTNEELSEVNKKLERKKAKIESFTRTLENGNIETTKQKGRVIVIEEKAPNGNFVKREVNLIDKSNRTTVYNPMTGKPTETTTNTNGQVSMVYDLDGKNAVITKSAEPKVTMVKQYKENDQIIQEFSDGSKIKISKGYEANNIHTVKTDKNNVQIEEIIENPNGNRVHNVFNKDQTISEVLNRSRKVTKTISENAFGEKFVSEYIVETPIYKAVYRPTGTDALGQINKGEWEIKYKPGKVYNDRYTIRATEGYVQCGINPQTNKLEAMESMLKCEDGRYAVTKNKLDRNQESFSTLYYDADGTNAQSRIPQGWDPFSNILGNGPIEIERGEKYLRINVVPFSEGHLR